MAEASRALGVPVVSGNVSFYNETEGRAVHPTPSVAMVGVADSIGAHPVSWFREPGDRVLLLGDDRRELGGSAYLRLLFSIEQGRPPRSISRRRRALGDLLRRAALAGLLHTAHDLAEGGLLVTAGGERPSRGASASASRSTATRSRCSPRRRPER